MKKKQWFGTLLLLIVAVIWGTAFAFQRSGMDRIEPMTFCASRMLLSAVVIGIPVLLMRKKRAAADAAEERIIAKNSLMGGVGCGIFLSLASIFQQVGIVHTSAGKAGFITAMYILIVPVINFILFKKRYSWLVWSAVLLGVFGLYLLCMTESLRLASGDILICVCALVFSGHILCCDHFVKRADPIRMSAVQFVTASVISWTAALIFEAPHMEGIIAAAVPILYCGLVSGGVGYTLQIVAQKYTDPTLASLLMSLEAVFAVIAGALMLHERMSASELAGCAVMFIAIIIVQLPLPKKQGGTEE